MERPGTQHPVAASRNSVPELPRQSNSLSRLRALLSSPEFRKQYEMFPEYDIAESVVRLRRHRGMTQADLAHAMRTWQPAIAKIETARSNLKLSTLKRIAEALTARIRILLEPAEFDFPERPDWWDCLDLGLAWPTGEPQITIITSVPSPLQGERDWFLGYTQIVATHQIQIMKVAVTSDWEQEIRLLVGEQ